MKNPAISYIRNFMIVGALLLSVSACNHKQKNNASATTTDPAVAQSSQAQTTPQPPQTPTPEATQSQNQNTSNEKPSGKGIKAPNFTLTRIDGKKFTLSNHFGKVIVLNIWATWCPPCRHEIPDFVKLQKELKSKGVLFVGVSVDQGGKAVVKPFAKAHHMDYPVMVDNGTVNHEYGPIKYIPTTFVIGRDGYIKGYQPGMLTANVLKPVLEKLIKQKS